MRRPGLLVALLGLILAGCGGDQSATQQPGQPAPGSTVIVGPTGAAAQPTATITGGGAAPTDRPIAAEPTEAPAATEGATDGPSATAAPSGGGAPTAVVAPPGPIAMPPGFGISIFAADLDDPRMMTLGPDGQVYLAERGAGRIVRLPDRDGDGVSEGAEVVADGLSSPSSIAFYQDGSLYVGETTQVLRLSGPDAGGVFQQRDVIVPGLPSGGHATRTVLFSRDWQTLFVSVGSSCNVCNEEDERRATIMRYNPDGSNGRIYTRGLRNAVGLALRPGTDELWATNNGRDNMGDDVPPETVNVAGDGLDFGWPRCHAGDVIDPELGSEQACQGVAPPAVKMQAHSAPLGLTFYTGEQFPEEYRGDLFVAFHGSWNRSEPTGYKVVRIPIEDGAAGEPEDFATGWLMPGGDRWGRPVDVLTAPDGSLMISDDEGGMIYRVFYTGE